MENVRNKLLEEFEQIENILNFYNLVVETKTNLPNNGYHIQNISIVARDLDYRDKTKEIDKLEKEIKSLKNLDQVRNKYISDFNSKFSSNISKDDTKIDLTNKKLKNDGLKMLSRINFPNLKELILSKNDISSFKCLQDCDIKNLEILKLDHNRINSIEVFPHLPFQKLKEIYLNENKLTNIEPLEKLIYFNDVEIIDIRNNKFDQKLEKNEKLIHDLKQIFKTIKADEGEDSSQEPEITDEKLNQFLNS